MQNRAGQNNWLLIPFYANPLADNYPEVVARFRDFARNAQELSGLNLAIVDDGSNLDFDEFTSFTSLRIRIEQNVGKAAAIRAGLGAVLEEDPGFIVQYDGDGDQSFIDIPLLARKIEEVSEGNPQNPALVIGDRYSERLVTAPNPDSITYRQSLLIFFGAIARDLGYDGIKDWVSGARAYSAEYAKIFLERSKASNYGVEAEQLVIASLEGARVGKVPLEVSRPRDPHTERTKWLENFEAYLTYSEELEAQGRGDLINILGELTTNLRNEKEVFQLNLTPIGEPTRMDFRKVGTAYTAEIPQEYRMNYFNGEGPFRFKEY